MLSLLMLSSTAYFIMHNVKFIKFIELNVLHLFVIPVPVCNLSCPDSKSLCLNLKSLSRFVIFLPQFEIS